MIIIARASRRAMPLSRAEIDYVRDGIDQNMRNDGRTREDYRELTLDLGVIPQATGSARARLGLDAWSTDVIVTVKAEIGAPSAEHPGDGRLRCAVELSSASDTAYGGRGGEARATELSRALERSLLGATAGSSASLSAVAAGERNVTARTAKHGEGCALDMSALGIQRGKSCWILQVDGLVLADDGNVLDALSMATRAALFDAKIPKVTAVAGPNPDDPAELELDDDPEECSRLDVSGVPVIVTLTRVGKHSIVDATKDEESMRDPRLCVGVDATGKVRCVHMIHTGPHTTASAW